MRKPKQSNVKVSANQCGSQCENQCGSVSAKINAISAGSRFGDCSSHWAVSYTHLTLPTILL
eukprot:5129024-Pyramimonas_sp.AAC.1